MSSTKTNAYYKKKAQSRKQKYKNIKNSRWTTYGNAVAQLASDAWEGVKFIKGIVNTEFKNVDINSSATAVAGGNVLLLNATTQGDGQTNREGSSFRMKSVDVRFLINYNGAAGFNATRVMLVLDRQTNGIAPAVTDILATNTIDSPRNLDYRKRFKILSDKVYLVGANSQPQRYSQVYKKLDVHTQCFASSNLGTVADISTHGLFLVFLSDQAVNGPTFNYYTRIRFVDN